MSKNVFVLGLDELNHTILRTLPGAENYRFHQLLTKDELQEGTVSVPYLLEEAHRRLDAFDGSIDAVVGYWDFPVSMMVPILCDRYGLRSASLEAVVKCEHKYWSRLEQQKVIEEHPAFALLDLNEDRAHLPEGLSFPVWVKPVKSASSEGAYYVRDQDELETARDQVRSQVDRIGVPFNDILAMLQLPPEIAEVGGRAAIVEEAATGHQFTVEGFSRGGRVHLYGLVDSVPYPGYSSFLRYQYPSSIPALVRERVAEVSRRVITAVGLSDTTFNIEYFWDPTTDRLALLEINARHSQSHALLFQLVDGVPNHACMVDLALDREPHLPDRQGPYACAAKWFLRAFTGGVVRRVPTAERISRLEDRLPGTRVQVMVEEGERLSTRYGEDSYSYVLAQIYVGGQDEAELLDKYTRCVEALEFEVVDEGPASPWTGAPSRS